MARDKNNLVKIPGELHSTATGNITVGTDEVFDYDSSTRQDAINHHHYNASLKSHWLHEVFATTRTLVTSGENVSPDGATIVSDSSTVVRSTREATSSTTVSDSSVVSGPTSSYDSSANQTTFAWVTTRDVVREANDYTFAEAVASVPTPYRNGGLNLTFISDITLEYKKWLLLSNTWSTKEEDWNDQLDTYDRVSLEVTERQGYYVSYDDKKLIYTATQKSVKICKLIDVTYIDRIIARVGEAQTNYYSIAFFSSENLTEEYFISGVRAVTNRIITHDVLVPKNAKIAVVYNNISILSADKAFVYGLQTSKTYNEVLDIHEIENKQNIYFGKNLWYFDYIGFYNSIHTLSTDISYQSCCVPILSGETYRVIQQRYGDGSSPTSRLFAKSQEGVYTNTETYTQNIFDVSVADDGSTYCLQVLYNVKYKGYKPLVYSYTENSKPLYDELSDRVSAVSTIDAQPTRRSNNSVSSNGVFENINFASPLENLYIYPETSATDMLYGYEVAFKGFIDQNGVKSTTSGWYSSRVQIINGHTYQTYQPYYINKSNVRVFRIDYDEINDTYNWVQVKVHNATSGTWTIKIDESDTNIYVLQNVRHTAMTEIPGIYDTDDVIFVTVKEKVEQIESNITTIDSSISGITERINNLEERHLNICVLGNSYTCDSFMYVPFILQNYGITCNIHLFYRGSGSINTLINEWTESAATSSGHTRSHYAVDTRTQSAWVTATRLSSKELVELENDWDMIVTTNQSVASLDPTEFDNVDTLVQLINASMPNPYKLCYSVAYTRNSSDNPTLSLQTQTNAVKVNGFSEVFPVGTAIFDARQNTTLNVLGDGGNLWGSDKVHLQDGIPCYIAALTIVEKIFRMYGLNHSVMQDPLRPTEDWCVSHSIKDRNGDSCGLGGSDETLNVYLAQKAAIVANNNPTEILAI